MISLIHPDNLGKRFL